MRMVVVGEHPGDFADWLDKRRKLGQDGYDEVWQGEYHVAPMAHSRYASIQSEVIALLRPHARAAGAFVFGPVNVGDNKHNFRVPEAVVLRERYLAVCVPTAAIVVEIVSQDDETHDKFDFYFSRGVEELLVVDSSPGSVEWYGRGEEGFTRTGRSVLLGLTEDELASEIDWPED